MGTHNTTEAKLCWIYMQNSHFVKSRISQTGSADVCTKDQVRNKLSFHSRHYFRRITLLEHVQLKDRRFNAYSCEAICVLLLQDKTSVRGIEESIDQWCSCCGKGVLDRTSVTIGILDLNETFCRDASSQFGESVSVDAVSFARER